MKQWVGEEEKELIAAAQGGDSVALTELFNANFPRVYRYMLARTGRSEDAEDLTQEVFIRMLDGLGRYQWRDVPFTAWLFKIAHNIVVSRYRRDGAWMGKTTTLSESISTSATGPEDEVETRMALEQVLSAAQQLPPMQRRVVELRFAAGLTVAETAQVLSKTENNVKVIQHKAIARLKQYIGSANGLSEDDITQGSRISR
jgi:RNA polymerase sigma-70 factor (ECF subfamily)